MDLTDSGDDMSWGGGPDLAMPGPDLPTRPAPTLSTLVPARASSAGGGTLTLTGTGFQLGATVTVGGGACTNPTITATQIKCTLPALAGSCGAQAVVITNPDTQSVTNTAAATPFSSYSSAPALVTATTYKVGTSPLDLVVGDYNGDKKADLVTVDRLSNSISLLTGVGNGTFNLDVSAGLGAAVSPVALTRADLNADMRLDVVAVSTGGMGSIAALLGNGMGAFGVAVNTNLAGATGLAVTFGNYVPGSKGDLVTFDSSLIRILVHPGNGAGSFAAPIMFNLPVGASGPLALVAADVNKDKLVDLLVVNQTTANVTMFLGNGMATVFGAGTNLAMGAGANYLVVADFNKDTNPDLATTNGMGNSVSVRLGNGMGGFGAAPTNYLVGTNPQGIGAADVDGDGVLDLVAANSGSQNVSVLGGLGNGTFNAAVNFPAGAAIQGIATGDYNADGLGDIAAVAPVVGNAVVLLGMCK